MNYFWKILTFMFSALLSRLYDEDGFWKHVSVAAELNTMNGVKGQTPKVTYPVWEFYLIGKKDKKYCFLLDGISRTLLYSNNVVFSMFFFGDGFEFASIRVFHNYWRNCHY